MHREISDNSGQAECDEVLAFGWLGQPQAPDTADLRAIVPIQRGFNDGRPPVHRGQHAGEAECLHFARKLDGMVVTDDNIAYDTVRRSLGVTRVQDTIDILRDAVVMADITEAEAFLIANTIRNSGRHLRRCHPATLPQDYFKV